MRTAVHRPARRPLRPHRRARAGRGPDEPWSVALCLRGSCRRMMDVSASPWNIHSNRSVEGGALGFAAMSSASVTLLPTEADFLSTARRAILATVRTDGRPRLVPLAFAVAPWTDEIGRPLIYSALDEKAKSVADPRRLGRVRDILARPEVSLLVDRWDEDWSALAWLRLDGQIGRASWR